MVHPGLENEFYYLTQSLPRRVCSFRPILKSERLTLTIFDPRNDDDADWGLWCSNHPAIKAVVGSVGFDSREKWHAFRSATLIPPKFTPRQEHVSGPAAYAVRLGSNNPQGERIGIVLLACRDLNVPPDLGWLILPPHQRQGYASEAAKRLLDYFLDEFQGGFRNASPPIGITAILSSGNPGSVGVARKIGMVHRGEVSMAFPKGKLITIYGSPAVGLEDKKFTPDQTVNVVGIGEAGIKVAKLLFGDNVPENFGGPIQKVE
jgi:RimJ/RimL family protein N-acetyltransferase